MDMAANIVAVLFMGGMLFNFLRIFELRPQLKKEKNDGNDTAAALVHRKIVLMRWQALVCFFLAWLVIFLSEINHWK